MKEVFEKIKERVCEFVHERNKSGSAPCKNQRASCLQLIRVCDLTAIVNQVAEEYQECDLCYFGNPCEYQNKDARMPESELNNGWFPCSEMLPEDNEIHECTAQFNTGMRYIEYAYYDMAREEWWTHDDTGLVNVIAWKPSPQPYRGE